MADAASYPRTVKKVPLLQSIIVALILLASAGMVLHAMMVFSEEAGPGIHGALETDPRYKGSITGVSQVDKLIKMVHYVFSGQFLLKDINYWVLEWWFMACLSLIFFQSIDFDRLNMRGVPFYVFFYQYVSIGICWPLVMIYYLWKRNAHSGRFQGGSVRARVVIMGVAILVTAAAMASLSQLKYEGNVFFWTIHFFLFLPVALPLLTYLVPSETSPRSSNESALGQRYENLCYAFFAGISFLMYWRWLPIFIEQYGFSVGAVQLALKDIVATHAQVFLMYDCLSSVIVMTLFICVDGGLLASLFTLLSAPIISPGAAVAIYLLYRESFIYGTSTGQWSTKVHSPPAAKKHQ